MSKKRLLICCATVIGVVLFFLFRGSSVNVAKESYERVRNEKGVFEDGPTPSPSEDDALLSLKARAGITQSNSGKSYSSSQSIGDRSYYNIDTVCIRAGDEQELTLYIAQTLGRHLENVGPLKRIIIVPYGKSLPAGSKLPQCFFTVSLGSVDSDNLGIAKTVRTAAQLRGGSSAIHPRFSFRDSLSTPGMDWSLSGKVQHKLNFKGVAIGQNLEAVAGAEIAQAFSKQIETKWKELREKMPGSGKLPEFFVPDYQALQLPEALAKYAPKQVYSGTRTFMPYDSLWTFPVQSGVEPPLESLKATLEASGLETDRIETSPSSLPGLRMKSPDKTEVLEIWKVSEDDSFLVSSGEATYAIRHYQRFGREQIHGILDQLLDETHSIQLLALLRDHWTDRHREAFLQRITEDPPHSPFTLLAAVETLKSIGKTEAALQLLPRTYLFDRASGGAHLNRIKRIGKKLHDDPKWRPSYPDEEEMASFNFPTLNAEGTDFPCQLSLNDLFFYHTMDHHGEHELRYIRITNPSQTPEGKEQYTIEDGKLGPQSRSWGTRVESLPYSLGSGYVTTEDGSQFHSNLIARKADNAPRQFVIDVAK